MKATQGSKRSGQDAVSVYYAAIEAVLGDRAHEAEVDPAVSFFRDIVKNYSGLPRPAVISVVHFLPGTDIYLCALRGMGDLRTVIPKPKSIDSQIAEYLEGKMPIAKVTRDECSDPASVLSGLLGDQSSETSLVISDIGGYFAPSINRIVEEFPGRVLGVIEDTENGHRKYEETPNLSCPVYSAARSPLKEPEDYLVGQSIVYSIESLIRNRAKIIQGRAALVIGFGKIGSSVAKFLRGRDVLVSVYDQDPLKRVQAMAQGFNTYGKLAPGLSRSGLIVCATGNKSLREADCRDILNGAYIATVTSADDELDLNGLRGYKKENQGPAVTCYTKAGQYFYLLNHGNAVNFMHGAAVGSFIHLVQAELLASIKALQDHSEGPGIFSISTEWRKRIAQLWLDKFRPSTGVE